MKYQLISVFAALIIPVIFASSLQAKGTCSSNCGKTQQSCIANAKGDQGAIRVCRTNHEQCLKQCKMMKK